MVRESYTFNVTVPAGTLATAPQVTAMTFPARIVRWVRYVVPPGPNGLVGFRIASNGTQQIPVNVGAWIIENDAKERFDFETPIQSGSWQLTAYNTGAYPHMLTVTFGVDVVTPASLTAPVAPVSF